jgi:hypothetical protein
MRLGRGLFHVLLFTCAICCVSGCSGNRSMPMEFGALFPVEGKVTFDGKPLRGGNVTFFSMDREVTQLQPMGLIDDQGNYFVSSYQQKGAPAGKYRVTVIPGTNDKNIDQAVENSPYTNWEKSPLIVTVQEKAPAGAYDLHLKRVLR